jgi:hypothetical protein
MKRPVFVVGCPRSGTTLLYSMLVAAGGFAAYRKETYVYELAPRFPDLAAAESRERFLAEFLSGYLGKVPGLDVEPLARRAAADSRTPGEFLPRLMTAIAAAQQMERWVEATPAHVLWMREIKRFVPDALFVHVVRDGRDCAISNDKQHWLPVLPWDRGRSLGVAALYWEWIVRAGRAYGRANPRDYFEVRFEDLIADPRTSLARIGGFIDHDLDYDRIVQNPVHALKKPNTSFREERERADFNPVGRWKDKCTAEDLELCEQLVGRFLEQSGYAPACWPASRVRPVRAQLMRAVYMTYFNVKHALKAHTPLGRFTTSTRQWAEQPKAGEPPVRPVAVGGAPGVTAREYGVAR